MAERQRRTKARPAKSPVPARYDFDRDELSLLEPVRHPLDARLASLCKRFARSSDEERAATRGAIRRGDFDTLLEFALRAALFAIRERKAAWAIDGLTAVTMIEAGRADDPRDILVALGVLHHAARRAGLNADRLFREMGAQAEPGMAELLDDLRTRPRGEKELGAWGYEEVETEDGIGLVDGDFGGVKPARDLVAIAREIVKHLATQNYRRGSIEVGEIMPRVWLESRKNEALDQALRACKTGISVMAQSRRTDGAESECYVFLHEMKTQAAAQQLLGIARKKKPPKPGPSFFCKVELAEGRLFCLMIARARGYDVPGYETQESLARFAAPLGDILRGRAPQ